MEERGARMGMKVSFARECVRSLRDLSVLDRGVFDRFMASAAHKPTFVVHVRKFGDMTVRTKSSDYDVLRQVFRDKEYDFTLGPQGKRIQQAYDEMLDAGVT